MIILHGIHHFAQKRIACRKDFCNACEREVLTEHLRSFDCWHLFFIPLIPLGHRRRWVCTQCQSDPRARHRTSRFFKIIGVFILALISFVSWAVPSAAEAKPDDVGMMWAMRFIFPVLFIISTYFVFFRKDDGDLTNEKRRRTVIPLGDDTCVYCLGPLQKEPSLHCPQCQVQVHTEV